MMWKERTKAVATKAVAVFSLRKGTDRQGTPLGEQAERISSKALMLWCSSLTVSNGRTGANDYPALCNAYIRGDLGIDKDLQPESIAAD